MWSGTIEPILYSSEILDPLCAFTTVCLYNDKHTQRRRAIMSAITIENQKVDAPKRLSSIFEDPTMSPKQKMVSVMKKPPENVVVKEQNSPRKRPSFTGQLKMFSTRLNTSYRWKQHPTSKKKDKSVIGALEVVSEPYLDLHAKLIKRPQAGKESDFEKCIEIWEELKLRKRFVEACESIPPSMSCCGLVQDNNKHAHDLATVLNRDWAKAVNKEVKPHGYKISIFVWEWNNASGPRVTSVLMVRFHSYSRSSKSRMSSSSASTAPIFENHGESNSSLPHSDDSQPSHKVDTVHGSKVQTTEDTHKTNEEGTDCTNEDDITTPDQ